MKKIKILFLLLSFVMLFNFATVFAKVELPVGVPGSAGISQETTSGKAYQGNSQEKLEKSYNLMSKVLNAILSTFAWLGYAVAIGVLVFVGVKYVMSGANEKANLKGSASKYLIGVALIVFCSTIAAAAANIANTTGENTNTGIVDKGIEISGIKIGDKNLTDAERKEYQEMIEKLEQVKNQTWNTKGFKFDHIIVHTPVGVDAICDDGVGSDPVLSADTLYHNGKEFKYWLVKRVETSTLDSSIYKETDKDFLALGSDRFWDIAGPSDYTYEIWAIYE